MKRLFISILLGLPFITIHAQKYRDTLYDSYIKNDSNLQIIFIDTPNSHFHTMVFQHLLSDSGSNHSSPLKYAGDWISVHMYRGKSYAYYPSEPYFNLFLRISDSTILVNDFNDGLVTYSVKKVNQRKNKFVFLLISSSGIKHTLKLQKKNNEIYELNSSLLNTKKLKVVKKETFFQLPIIVNYCPENRCQEFDFKKGKVNN
jgi:hypothetical protein